MDYEQLQQYKKSLLDQALQEGIRRNNEQSKIWTEYKERHASVIEGLETFQRELAVDCMVPIGKRALMRGKLTHTNEILVSLGEGYFGKYSAAQAIALCNRRIKRANDILEGLEKEQNLFETRLRIPNSFDAFGGEGREDTAEFWDNEKLDDWRVKHRQREKEYRKKLSELKNTEKQDIVAEEDLFAKLDALELQEELEDELIRLEAARPDFYEQDLEDGQVYEESESDSRSDSPDPAEGETEEEDSDENLLVIDEKESPIKCADSSENESKTPSVERTNTRKGSDAVKSTESEDREKKVAFGELQLKYFNNSEKIESICRQPVETNSIEIEDRDDVDSDEDDVIRIYAKHSEYEPEVAQVEDDSIRSPRDIYKMMSRPKSILKKSPNHATDSKSLAPPLDDDNTDDEIEYNTTSGVSAYNTVVKEIREHVPDDVHGIQSANQKRPVSKFKRDRAILTKK